MLRYWFQRRRANSGFLNYPTHYNKDAIGFCKEKLARSSKAPGLCPKKENRKWHMREGSVAREGLDRARCIRLHAPTAEPSVKCLSSLPRADPFIAGNASRNTERREGAHTKLLGGHLLLDHRVVSGSFLDWNQNSAFIFFKFFAFFSAAAYFNQGIDLDANTLAGSIGGVAPQEIHDSGHTCFIASRYW